MVLNCPHCKGINLGHTCVGESLTHSSYYDYRWNSFFQCRNCRNITVVCLRILDDDKKPMKCSGNPTDEKFTIIGMYPQFESVEAPNSTPKPIANNYVEAVDNLKRKSYTSAAMMFRKVLDRATVEIDSSLSKKSRLIDRIDDLSKNHMITPSMKDWADIIRLDGNEAAHNEDANEDTTRQLQVFTEVFLTYSFTLPKLVEDNRKKANKAPASPPST